MQLPSSPPPQPDTAGLRGRPEEGVECFTPSLVAAEPRLQATSQQVAPAELQLEPRKLTERLESLAKELGLERLGVTSVEPLERGRRHLEVFRERGYAGRLDYLARGSRHDPRLLMPEARSVIVALMAYPGTPDSTPVAAPLHGRVARYARGEDYHIVLKQRLLALGRGLAELAQRPVLGRACVDTAPLLERELAARTGLGFQGKSTMFIAPGLGSYVLIGELLVDIELAPTSGSATGCGQCRACLDACPTQAFPDPYVLDARRCISYFTIEVKGEMPEELRAAMQNRVFGCDVCQEVCPYNAPSGSPRRARQFPLGSRDNLKAPELVSLLNLGAAAYRKLVRRTALRRISRESLQRNAAVALGNSGDARALPALIAAVSSHPSPLVRSHAAWALGKLVPTLAEPNAAATEARGVLQSSLDQDPEPQVRSSAQRALRVIESAAGIEDESDSHSAAQAAREVDGSAARPFRESDGSAARLPRAP